MSIRRTGDDGYLTFTMEGKEDTYLGHPTLFNSYEQAKAYYDEVVSKQAKER